MNLEAEDFVRDNLLSMIEGTEERKNLDPRLVDFYNQICDYLGEGVGKSLLWRILSNDELLFIEFFADAIRNYTQICRVSIDSFHDDQGRLKFFCQALPGL